MWILKRSFSHLIPFHVTSSTSPVDISRRQIQSIMTKKKNYNGSFNKRQKTGSKTLKAEGSNEEVLLLDVERLLSAHNKSELSREGDDGQDVSQIPLPSHAPPERFTEIEVKILELSSSGDGLGLSSTQDHVYVVPFSLPGDVVKAKVITYFPQNGYTLTDFIEVLVPAPQRDSSLIQCPYFSKCSGCQLQMLPYNEQLKHKRKIIEKAYTNFSTLRPEIIPAVGETIGSPLQYGYRTKLTPHFDGPPGSNSRKYRKEGISKTNRKGFDKVPPIGFMLKGTRKVIDIEDCPIGTDTVRTGMVRERERVAQELANFKKGATLLLRESTSRTPKSILKAAPGLISHTEIIDGAAENGPINISDEHQAHTEPINYKGPTICGPGTTLPYVEEKICITDSNAISTEFVDDFIFTNPARAFFQNNNSILPKFTAYIRDHILSKTEQQNTAPIKYLIDAYCGSGLFTVTLSSLFSSSMGIDVAEGSIESARTNATRNGVSNASFMAADASALFKEVKYPPGETVVIIDPPRKGCDDVFLQQLLHYGPKRVVYVSCNVHTQARDIGILVDGNQEARYEIESIRGFDFFPQTGHVEGVAVLTKSAKLFNNEKIIE